MRRGCDIGRRWETEADIWRERKRTAGCVQSADNVIMCIARQCKTLYGCTTSPPPPEPLTDL